MLRKLTTFQAPYAAAHQPGRCACNPRLLPSAPNMCGVGPGPYSQDPSKPATVDNLVLLTHAEADEHDQLDSLDALRQQVGAPAGPARRRVPRLPGAALTPGCGLQPGT